MQNRKMSAWSSFQAFLGKPIFLSVAYLQYFVCLAARCAVVPVPDNDQVCGTGQVDSRLTFSQDGRSATADIHRPCLAGASLSFVVFDRDCMH